MALSRVKVWVAEKLYYSDLNAEFNSILNNPGDLISGLYATQAQQETGTATDVVVVTGRQQFHPSAAKGWCQATAAGAATTSYNVTSVTDNATGDANIVWATDFATANYCVVNAAKMDSAVGVCSYIGDTNHTAGIARSLVRNASTDSTMDPTNHMVIAFGDQA